MCSCCIWGGRKQIYPITILFGSDLDHRTNICLPRQYSCQQPHGELKLAYMFVFTIPIFRIAEPLIGRKEAISLLTE